MVDRRHHNSSKYSWVWKLIFALRKNTYLQKIIIKWILKAILIGVSHKSCLNSPARTVKVSIFLYIILLHLSRFEGQYTFNFCWRLRNQDTRLLNIEISISNCSVCRVTTHFESWYGILNLTWFWFLGKLFTITYAE